MSFALTRAGFREVYGKPGNSLSNANPNRSGGSPVYRLEEDHAIEISRDILTCDHRKG